MFDTLIVFLKDFLEKLILKNSAGDTNDEKLPSMQKELMLQESTTEICNWFQS